MTRFTAAVLAVVLGLTMGLSAAVKKYGKPLTVKQTTKISDIYANPDQYVGKRVRVSGPIVDVCSERGCWIAIGGDRDFQAVRFKVDDGVIVFPMSAKGLTATVEGVLSAEMVTTDEDVMAQMHAVGAPPPPGMMHDMGGDMSQHHAPPEKKLSIVIAGDGAEVE